VHGCPNLTEGSWCHEHLKQQPRSPSTRVTQSRDHRRKRERIVRQGPPWTCSICGEPIMSSDDMDVHHVVAVADGGAEAMTAPAHSTLQPQPRGEDDSGLVAGLPATLGG
jgi:5-methylcytosine-specific restriction endonuclease McrA